MLLVTIHDVTPALQAETRALWALCRRLEIVPGLLVVPEWHGHAPIDADPAFLEWIRSAADAGAELFLHGYRHDEVGLPRGWRDAWRAWGRTNREGEFLTLDGGAAAERIAAGLTRLAVLERPLIGWVPPAWLAREAGFAAAAAAGLACSEDDTTIRLLQDRRRIRSPVVRWSGRTAMRARGSAFVAAARWHLQRSAPVVRIALHPGDLAHPACVRSLERELARWRAARAPGRYADLLAA